MACSRCAQSACSCSLTAGSGVTVTGTGSTSNPWVVSASAAAETALTAVDSTTIDLTTSGIANHTLTAAVRVSTAAGQILTSDAAGLLVTCESVQDCVASMMTANGFVYDDANGQWDATGTSGQVLTANGSGGATWTVPATGAQTPLTVLDTTTIDLTASGTNNHTLSAAVKLSAAAGQILTSDAAGLLVTCEAVQDCVGSMLTAAGFTYDDANNRFNAGGTSGQVLTSNGAGGATWAAAGGGGAYVAQSVARSAAAGGTVGGTAPTPFGSGQTLTFSAGNGIDIQTSAGPIVGISVRTSAASMAAAGFACADSNGAPIFITATGLRTLPPHTSQALLRLTAAAAANGIAANSGVFTGTVDRVISNPSTCRAVSVHINTIYRWTTYFFINASNDMAAGGEAYSTLGGSGVMQGPFDLAFWNPSYPAGQSIPVAANRGRFSTSSAITDSFTIAASASFTHQVANNLYNRSTPGALTAFNAGVGVETAGILVTQ